jgi:crotonobetainyl-CoA:carnitine CoA-transferase CaiB-like acyl-CoA transferase
VSGPLEGLRILSLAEQYPGPYATLLLADLGADVVLVERPAGGDPARGVSTAFFEALNRNKRSIALDLKHPGGRAALLRLAADADVLLEGFRPGTMARLGLDHQALHRINPTLVYVSIAGFGQDGPARNLPAHDLSYQAMAGLLFERLATHDTRPVQATAVADLAAGMFGAVAALVGLVQRAATGRGCEVDVSMFDGLVSWMTALLFPMLNDAGPVGLPRQPAYGLFETADGGLLSLSIAHEDRFWQALSTLTGLEDAAAVPMAERERRCDELRERLAAAILGRTREEWKQALTAADVPFGPVRSLEEVAGDAHVAARGLLVDVPGDGTNPSRMHVRQPLTLDGARPGPTRHAPRLGEHTREVLTAAGYHDDEIAALFREGVAASADEAAGVA